MTTTLLFAAAFSALQIDAISPVVSDSTSGNTWKISSYTLSFASNRISVQPTSFQSFVKLAGPSAGMLLAEDRSGHTLTKGANRFESEGFHFGISFRPDGTNNWNREVTFDVGIQHETRYHYTFRKVTDRMTDTFVGNNATFYQHLRNYSEYDYYQSAKALSLSAKGMIGTSNERFVTLRAGLGVSCGMSMNTKVIASHELDSVTYYSGFQTIDRPAYDKELQGYPEIKSLQSKSYFYVQPYIPVELAMRMLGDNSTRLVIGGQVGAEYLKDGPLDNIGILTGFYIGFKWLKISFRKAREDDNSEG